MQTDSISSSLKMTPSNMHARTSTNAHPKIIIFILARTDTGIALSVVATHVPCTKTRTCPCLTDFSFAKFSVLLIRELTCYSYSSLVQSLYRSCVAEVWFSLSASFVTSMQTPVFVEARHKTQLTESSLVSGFSKTVSRRSFRSACSRVKILVSD